MENINEAYIERLSNKEIQSLVDDYIELDYFFGNHLYEKTASGFFNIPIEAVNTTDYLRLMPYLCRELLKRINH